jgi:hypothetical protein
MKLADNVIEILREDENVLLAELNDKGDIYYITKGDPFSYRDPLHRLSKLTIKRLERYNISSDNIMDHDEPGLYNRNTILT